MSFALAQASVMRRALMLIWAVLWLVQSRPVIAQSYWSSGGQDPLGVGNGHAVQNLSISLHVTQNMVANTSSGDLINSTVTNGGFSLQLNGTPNQQPSPPPVWWTQWVIRVRFNQVDPYIQYFDNAGVKNPPNLPPIATLPSNTGNMIPAGYILTTTLSNDPNTGFVNGITQSVTDNTGKTYTVTMPSSAFPLPTYNSNVVINSSFPLFLLNIVGPPSYEHSAFVSGAGYLTYSIPQGQLTTVPTTTGVITTGEGSNVSYGITSPPTGSTLVQPFTTPYAGAVSSNMDTADNILQVYNFAQNGQNNGNIYLNQFAFNGSWSPSTNVMAGAVPAATLGSPVISYQNTLYNMPEAFYFVPITAGGQQVEQLWGKTWSPTSLTTVANAQPAALGSGLVGYIDPVAGTDNVFYQGTDQQVHVLTWSPGAPWAEDKRILGAPVAAFASALTGHMNAKSQEIFYIGANQHIYELWRWSKNFDGWHTTDVTSATSSGPNPLPAVGSALTGFYDANANADVVFYQGIGQHLYEMLFAKGQWSSIDVTQAIQVFAENGTSLAAHINTISGSQELFYVGSDQTIQEAWMWSSATPAWQMGSPYLNGSANVLASPGSPLATDINSVGSKKADEIYYTGVDGNLHGLSWSSPSGWAFFAP